MYLDQDSDVTDIEENLQGINQDMENHPEWKNNEIEENSQWKSQDRDEIEVTLGAVDSDHKLDLSSKVKQEEVRE